MVESTNEPSSPVAAETGEGDEWSLAADGEQAGKVVDKRPAEEVAGKTTVRRLNKKTVFGIAGVALVVCMAFLGLEMLGGESEPEPQKSAQEDDASPAEGGEQTVDGYINKQTQESAPDTEAKLKEEEAETEAELMQAELEKELEARQAATGSESGATGEGEEEDPWEKARKDAMRRYAQAYFADNFAARKSGVFVEGARQQEPGQQGGERSEADSLSEARQRAELAQRMQAMSAQPAGQSGAQGANMAGGSKAAFFANRESGPTRNPNELEEAVSPYEIKAGTLLPLVLETGVNSDVPGLVKARFAAPVYDTVTGNHLLIPSGAVVIGQYNADQTYGDQRVQVAWSRLILPNGASMELGNIPGVSLSGYSGLHDQVDEHWDRVVAGVVLSSALAGSLAAAGGDLNQFEESPGQAALSGVATNVNQTGQEITKKNLEVQPTLTIRPGMKVAAFVREDLVLKPYRE